MDSVGPAHDGWGFEPVVLRADELARFRRDGFTRIDRPIVPADELAEIRTLVEELCDRFDELPRELAYDLGDVKHHAGRQHIPEINRARELEPRLAASAGFARCRDLARQIVGERAECHYDHVICKLPHRDTTIEWHQDLAYAVGDQPVDHVHIWLALHEVTEANGCLRFLPSDVVTRLLPHHHRGNSAESHALVADITDDRAAVACPLGPGMATLHRLTTLHSSGPNTTDAPRLAWVLQFHDPPPTAPFARVRGGLGRALRNVRGAVTRSVP